MSATVKAGRLELKYVVRHDVAAALRARIASWVKPDPHAGPRGFYPVVSLYYDTPDLVAYHEKIDGVPDRRKVRLRVYPGRDRQAAFLEVKERRGRAILKRRARGPLADLLPALSRVGLSDLIQPSLRAELIQLGAGRLLLPTVFTLYNREAWQARLEPRLRVTFDRNLRCRRFAGEFAWDLTRDPFSLGPELVVVEVKCDGALPGWLLAALHALQLEVIRVSKYCLAVDRVLRLPR